MDIKGLQYFIAAAERLNFTTAAKECYITQTAMSLHISKMEDEIGFKLFNRNRNKRVMELTNAGQDFVRRARKIVREYEMALRYSAGVAAGVTGRLSLLVPSCIEGFVLMDRLHAFREHYPDVALSIYVEPPDRHINNVKSGFADICVGAPDDMEPDEDFAVVRLREDPIVVICSKRHAFAKEMKVDSGALRNERVILIGPKGIPHTYRILHNSRLQLGFEPESTISVNNMDEMLLMIELDRGIGFLPRFVQDRIGTESAGVVFIPCDNGGSAPTMTTALGYLKNNANPAIGNLMGLL
ncbi:MAG: LysR family transcriptional regulator [Clostridiales Family XIII bacterium]|jgi:DNA-binding transcriptional LysR family regulator|nr:LysR family transcriptional regulator [Clostridiales Family XIII bacterium]